MLIKYIRNGRVPFGTIVAKVVGEQLRVGVSICRKQDHFNKELGRKIAEGRADLGVEQSVPNRHVVVDGFEVPLYAVVESEVRKMVERSDRYFKNKSRAMTHS